jgi:type IV pilus biogenesis protein CpaD/CtpE
MASVIYDSFIADVFAGTCTTASTYKAMLVTSAYAEDRGAHSKRSSVTSFEVSGTGYTAGGASVTLSASLNTTTHKLTLTIGAASWPSSTITARKLIVYRSTGTAANDNLVACIDNGADLVSSSSTMTWNSSTWEIPLPAPV